MQRLTAIHGQVPVWRSARIALAVTAWLLVVQPSLGQTNANNNSWQPPGPIDSYQWSADSKPAKPDAGFHAYSLQQLDAASAQRQLKELLGNAPGVEIVVDAERNRLLVRGDAQIQQWTADLLTKLDRPAAGMAAASPPGDSNAEPQLQAYALTPASRDVLLAWQRYAGQRNDLRVAIDERTSQALVLAPPDLHTQLRTELTQAQPPRSVPVNSTPPQAAPKNRLAGPVTVQLRHLRPNELRERLEKLVSRPLAASWDTSGQWQSFTLEEAPGAAVTVSVQRDSGAVQLNGAPEATTAWQSVIAALDSPPTTPGTVTQLVATKPASQDRVRQALKVLQSQGPSDASDRPSLVSMRAQPGDAGSGGGNSPLTYDTASQVAQAPPPATGGGSNQSAQSGRPDAQVAQSAIDLAEAGGDLLGPVQIEFIEGLDVIVLRGSERDVQRVMDIINQIEQLSAITVPAVEVYPLKYVDSEALGALLTRLYQQVLSPRIGEVSITPLGKPNALLLVGRPENVRMAIELIQKLDQPVPATTRFEVFSLKNASASEAKTMIDSFLEREEQEGAEEVPTLAPRALVVADVRTNTLVVSAGPRDLAEIAALVERIDAPSGAAIDQVRVFPLKHAVAAELAEVLRDAIQAQSTTTQTQQGEGTSAAPRASALEFTTIGLLQQETYKAGVLTGARVTADPRANALVVTAPADSMNLIAALVEQLDQAPDVVAELKVFTIVNGDAVSLTEMLRALFAAPEGQQGAGAGGAGEGGLVRAQFSYDERTNSIIAAGSKEDLAVVEAILLRLDEGDIRERETTVYRLKNAFAQNVADALNNWLATRRAAEQEAEVTISPFEQIEREVIIVPELASNSLIVSATPRYYQQVKDLIDQLDERPPMVMIQVLIAEVRLNDTDEFGVELGLQDSLLFDRSLLGDITTIDTSTTMQTPGGATTTTDTQTIVNAPGQPGFNFNNQTLGNNLSSAALATASQVASQGLSNFSLGRVNNDLGFGGFVFSASSNSVSVLLRALQEKRRLEVLSRPQIMALDGQEGIIQVGQQVPRITSSSLTQFGQVNSIIYEPVGIILHVVPRISPDGLVVMQVEAVKSEVGAEAEGIPISVSASGQILRAPRIDNTQAITTVSALSGQTVVLSGLLTTRKFDIHRNVPLISDIPLIGDLFRYDSVSEERRELLIILTPRIIYNKCDAEIVKQVESSRMSWILGDVIALNGESGLRSRCDEWGDSDTEAVYPTFVPGCDTFESYPEIRMVPAEGPALETPASQPTEVLPTPANSRRPSPYPGPLRRTSYVEPVRLPQVNESR